MTLKYLTAIQTFLHTVLLFLHMKQQIKNTEWYFCSIKEN